MKQMKQKPSKRLQELYTRELKLEKELNRVREEIRELINYQDLNKHGVESSVKAQEHL